MMERIAPLQHDSLVNIPEPSENAFLAGHCKARQFVLNALGMKRLTHAIIFSGPKGIGKATFAFHFVRHLLSLEKSEQKGTREHGNFNALSPASPIFRQIALGAHPLVLHITRPVNKNSSDFKTVLNVDEIRRINHFLSMTSDSESFRIVMIDPADDMNRSASNALLKNLEEPGSRVLFILISHSPGVLLPSIRSRCQLVQLMPLCREDFSVTMKRLLPRAFNALEEEEKLFFLSRGSVGKALRFWQANGFSLFNSLQKLMTPSVCIQEIHELAQAATSSGSSSYAFEMFHDTVLHLLSSKAQECVLSGQYRKAKNFAHLYRKAILETFVMKQYGLDKKQHLLIMANYLRNHDI